MKTVVTKSLIFGIFCWFAMSIAWGQTILFDQNFSSGSIISNYIGTTGTSLFTGIGTTGSGVSANINSGYLEFIKSGSNVGYLVRNTPELSSTNNTYYIDFNIAVPASEATSTTGAAVFYFGEDDGTGLPSYNGNGTVPANADVYCKLGVNFIGASGGFKVRDASSGGATGTSTITDLVFHTITIIINKQNFSARYLIPNTVNTYDYLSSNKWQVYVDGTKQFNTDLAPVTSTANPKSFKMIFNGGTGEGILGTIQMDNFRIRTVEGILPVSLTRFNAQVNEDKEVEVEWATATERNSKLFTLERSNDLKNYAPIAQLDAAGNSNNLTTYRFKDENPLLGTSYYRLLQTDLDGSTVPYRPVAVTVESDFSVFPNPVAATSPTWTIHHPQATDLTIRLTNPLGVELPVRVQPTQAQEWLVTSSQALLAGMYFLQLETPDKTHTKKVWIY